MVLLMAVSFSFAQMKNVKEAKSMANDVKPNFKQAEQLIKEAMKNPETKDLRWGSCYGRCRINDH